MEVNSLIDNLVSTCANDTALGTFCTTNFSKSVKVFNNLDKRNPPGETDCPFAVIYPAGKTVGIGIREKVHVVEIDCCVFNDKSDNTGNTKIVRFSGVHQIESFRKLAETAIAGYLRTAGLTLKAIEAEYDVIESFPFCWSGMILTITEVPTIGTDYLA